MSILSQLQARFAPILNEMSEDSAALLGMIRQTQDPKFGDYQANFAMPLGKQLGKPPREVATEILTRVDLTDLCEQPEIAGPGFINLRLRDDWITAHARLALTDDRLGIAPVETPRTYVLDFSSPNVAKPMHVGHIRSTVIGDALYRILHFLGHKTISDNHLGDWGTQFGMIIYGYKHFCDAAQYEAEPVTELGRLYKLVRQLVDYQVARDQLPLIQAEVIQKQDILSELELSTLPTDKKELKQHSKDISKLHEKIADARSTLKDIEAKIQAVDQNPILHNLAQEHAEIGQAVLQETAKLHEADPENTELWQSFMPQCLTAIREVYERLDITFDHELGESFYHDRLGEVVTSLEEQGLAIESDGAMCVFLDAYDTPMIVRKRDGAYLYSTTDLATIRYRLEEWKPDAILYVVDHRQSEHFGKLFTVAKQWDCENVDLVHVSFGTVLGDDRKPFKTRSGDTVGLESLLDEGVSRAFQVVSENDDAKPTGPELDEAQRRSIAEVVGIGALKYADLSQNRTSDYIFSYDKMLALHGNTATYMQYAYARIQNIFSRGGISQAELRSQPEALVLEHASERALALAILQAAEALENAQHDYQPNHLTNYLFEKLAKRFSEFYEHCPVLKADSPEQQASRLLLCDMTARTIKLGLSLLGIGTVDKM